MSSSELSDSDNDEVVQKEISIPVHVESRKKKKKRAPTPDPSDSDDSDDGVIHPEDFSPRKEMTFPSEPVDAVKAATTARKNAQKEALVGCRLDHSILSMKLVFRGEKNESTALVAMDDCVSGTFTNVYPKITFKDSKLKKDALQDRVAELITQYGGRDFVSMLLFFVLDDGDKAMIVLPVTLTNPANKPDVQKSLSKIDEAIEGQWQFALQLSDESIKYLYGIDAGMPSIFNPASSGVKFVKINSLQDFVAKKPSWSMIIDASRGPPKEKPEKRKVGASSGPEKKAKNENEYQACDRDTLLFTLPKIPVGYEFCSFTPPSQNAPGVGVLRLVSDL